MASKSRLGKLRFTAYLIVASVALLELVLQAGHAIVCLTHRPTEAANLTQRADESTILCVGDSWTFGIGAEQPELAYPSQLQRMLAERLPDRHWRTVNCGWPGQNSRDVLFKLGAQLDQCKPALTCVMIGGNDYWSLPDLLEDDEAIGAAGMSFQWRFRTGRLVALLMEVLRKQLAAPAPAPATPAATDDEAEEQADRGSPQVPEPRYPYPYDEAATRLKQEGWAAQRRGEAATAAELFEKVLTILPGDPQAHFALIDAYRRLGRDQEAAQQLAWLEEAHAAKPEYYVALYLLWALHSLGHAERYLEFAQKLVEEYPNQSRFWLALAEGSMDAGDVATAKRAIDQSIALRPTAEGYTHRARVYGNAKDPVEATLSVMRSYLLSKDEQQALRTLRGRSDFHDRRSYAQALEKVQCSQKQRLALERIGNIAFDDTRAAATKVLREHLRQIIYLCRAKGSEVVLMSFPMKLPSPSENLVAETMAAVAQEHGVVYVDHNAYWDNLLKTRTWQELSAPDGGHCNGEGYTIMTRLLVDQLLERTVVGR